MLIEVVANPIHEIVLAENVQVFQNTNGILLQTLNTILCLLIFIAFMGTIMFYVIL